MVIPDRGFYCMGAVQGFNDTLASRDTYDNLDL